MGSNMYSWNNIDELFKKLHNNNCTYIILINYEEITEDNFYMVGHADIDFLVDNSRKFAKIINAVPRFNEDDKIHYLIDILGHEVVIDVRQIGDGYYDTNWERTMIKDRFMFNNRFYINNTINYYYSLVYHAFLQKETISDDYLERLDAMAANLNIPAKGVNQHLEHLENYMRLNNYWYTLPYDIWVPLKKEYINPKYIKKYFKVFFRDCKYNLMSMLSRIKNLFIKKRG